MGTTFHDDYSVSEGLPRCLTKWWMRCRSCQSVQIDGLWTACSEFYVPWWAWPLEIVHRLAFGKVKVLPAISSLSINARRIDEE